eukprot:TRINITY_DN5441_c0_g2_i1.p1 TRINITY_DN5441_c0_g2~~TRINITY_DN5441_c0_g2_i1.p1  ORF type:complete len:271 (-),score=134.75 TRINITY_DN5441_c0_g2_i1:156-968(-)
MFNKNKGGLLSNSLLNLSESVKVGTVYERNDGNEEWRQAEKRRKELSTLIDKVKQADILDQNKKIKKQNIKKEKKINKSKDDGLELEEIMKNLKRLSSQVNESEGEDSESDTDDNSKLENIEQNNQEDEDQDDDQDDDQEDEDQEDEDQEDEDQEDEDQEDDDQDDDQEDDNREDNQKKVEQNDQATINKLFADAELKTKFALDQIQKNKNFATLQKEATTKEMNALYKLRKEQAQKLELKIQQNQIEKSQKQSNKKKKKLKKKIKIFKL